MKKTSSFIGVVIAIIAAVFYFSEDILGINLLSLIQSDTEAPIINVEELKESVVLNGDYTYDVSCNDNLDLICEVTIYGEIDTSTAGVKSVQFYAKDTSGNETLITYEVTVLDGVDSSVYIPAGYYDSIDGLTGDALKAALNDIITNHTEFPYTDDDTDVWDLLRAADEDPENSDNVILFYSGFSWPKECQDTNKNLLPDYCFENNDREASYTEWNREHIWSKSHGDFEEEDGYAHEEHKGGYALGAHTDAHHLVAAERAMNSTKNNRFFDDCHDLDKYDLNNDGVLDIKTNDDKDSNTEVIDRGFGNYTCGAWYFEPRDEVKGDVARMLFYMVIRYEGEEGDYVDLELTNDLYNFEDAGTAIKNSKLPYYENLEVLLQWHIDDPVSEWEIERNEVIYQYQGNRNPFIDMPELVELIWGTVEDNN